MSEETNEGILKRIARRFDQSLSALGSQGVDVNAKLKPGSVLVLLKHIEENILRPLSESDALPEITFGRDLQSYERELCDDIARGYAEWASVYGVNVNEASLFKMEEGVLLPLLGNLQGKTILDVGCGSGRYALRFAQAGATVTGIDLTPEMISVAQRKAGVAINFICGDILGADLPPSSFDIIFSSLAVTHIQDLSVLLGKLQSALLPNGKIVISDIHPCFKMIGSNVGFVLDNKFFEIRHYVHRVSDYFVAASKNALRVQNLIEFPDTTVLPFFLVVVLEAETKGYFR